MGKEKLGHSHASDWLPYIAVLVFGVLLTLVLVEFDAFERLHQFTRAHEDWELDELVVAGFSTLLVLLATTLIRVRREVERRRHEETRLHNLMRHDPLTGFPNRISLEEELLRRIGDGRRQRTGFAVAIMHIEGIDQIIDLSGHQVGDEVLRIVANRLRNAMLDNDLIARLPGNEFALIITDDGDSEGLSSITGRLEDILKNPIKLGSFSATLTTSLGVAVYPTQTKIREKLLQYASVAAHQSRAQSGNTTTFYDPQLDAVQRQRAELKIDILEALDNHQFIPVYQPLVCLGNGRLASFEVLARWKHPKRGMLPPRDFISAAEDSGLIGDIFWELLRQVGQTASAWPESIPIALNVSPVQLADEQFAPTLLTMLRAEAFNPRRLVIEITEDALVGDMMAVRETMGRLKGHGIRFSLDDFGTGYSSLHYLSQLPFDTIKIDKSFVSNFHRNNGNYQIVSSIIKLCRSLGLKTTGEGIETIEEATELLKLGCTYGQGYLFSKPVFPAEATRIIERNTTQSTRKRSTGNTSTITSLLPITRFE